jgi:uncharacterized protein YjbI with pentapeptide repeats
LRKPRNLIGTASPKIGAKFAQRPDKIAAGRQSMLARWNRAAGPQNSEPAGLAAKAADLQALRDAVVDAGGVGAGLWLSYLFTLFYFAIAAGAVTNRDLLLENAVKLPFLNVELPLKAFFILGPLVFLVIHAYVLLHIVVLAGKIGAFHAELQNQVSGDKRRAQLRRQLPSNIFVQSLAGPRDVREGPVGFFLRSVIQISLVAAPIALLVLFQLRFLPYHSEWITNWHRVAVVIDLGFLWLLWPPIARANNALIGWKDFKRAKVLAAAAFSILPVLLVVSVATFPGEWLDAEIYGPASFDLAAGRFTRPSSAWALPHELLVAGDVNYVTGQPRSFSSNVLVVPNFDIGNRLKVDTENRLSISPKAVTLRGRDLEGAVLASSNLRDADFTGARLFEANFFNADLRGAKLNCDSVGKEQIGCPDLRGISFNLAKLQGVSLVRLSLQGVSLLSTQLQGADLRDAQLEGADLRDAGLQGADLRHVRLQGADLRDAGLQGADLFGAQLQGANLSGAQLQGADLTYANLQAADIEGAFVWRANAPPKDLAKGVWGSPMHEAESQGLGCGSPWDICDWTVASFAALKTLIEEIPAGPLRDAALKRIAVLEQPPGPADQTAVRGWTHLVDPMLTRAQYLAAALPDIACTGDGSAEVIAGLIRQLVHRLEDDPRDAKLAAALLDEAKCPGGQRLSEDAKARLRQIRDRAQPPFPPPPPPGDRRQINQP